MLITFTFLISFCKLNPLLLKMENPPLLKLLGEILSESDIGVFGLDEGSIGNLNSLPFGGDIID